MSHFDDLAKEWDQNPLIVERTQKLYNAINKCGYVTRNSICLDYGCGTGLLSFYFQTLAEKIYLADSSKGMLSELESKIKKLEIKNMHPHFILNSKELKIFKDVNVIYCNMSLHHVEDVIGLIEVFFEILTPGGALIISDLLKEDGSFHSGQPDFKGHNGFDIEEIKKYLADSGFQFTKSFIYHAIKKTDECKEREYPLFLITGRK